MPFAVFRRHQRKLLAIFAIMAMFGFVLADTLPRLLSPAGAVGGKQNPFVVELYKKKWYRSDIEEMFVQRNNANMFMAALTGRPLFGDVNTRSIVDAIILQHEADRLHMPKGPEVGREWLKQATGGMMNRTLFEATLSRFGNRISGEQVLSDIASQVRIVNVRQLLGEPVVTPLDVFQAYRDQNERVSARLVTLPVDSFLAKVPEPTQAEVQAFYDKFKEVLPNPESKTPGFKVPRQVVAEILSVDGNALMKGFKDQIKEAELLSYYENRKTEFKRPSEFPDEIFLGHPELTPPQLLPFSEVSSFLSTSLAEEKAQALIVAKFTEIKDDYMDKFFDEYYKVLDDIEDAKKQGQTISAKLPKPTDLKDVAKKAELYHEITPKLSLEQAEHYGEVSNAEVGLTRMSGGRKFAAELFDPKANLYEPVELTDKEGRRYLVRKLEDNPPRVPSLDEVRSQVVADWKLDKARPLAEKAANEIAEQIRKAGGKVTGDKFEGYSVLTTAPLTKLQPGYPIPGQYFQTGPPTETPIPQVTMPGKAFRDAYFGLEPGTVAVAPNEPQTTYYVLTLETRIPASFAALYSPNGEYFRYRNEAQTEYLRQRTDEWMSQLRSEAGVPADWVPPDEVNRDVAKND
ncbi:hypothetical protein [Singulisphaera sp. PoT]|uniref:peptidylprolyl isomerase n=1 Tax=Singulisphaera sp. PoT TaxID=3411797 RepID=UPI003BF4FA06